ncbi:hypothetical protein AG1IA_09377 [Rhizoctonia solani AG-1 IA]|uniref:Uncharacterized protein n=1 Tax=Thanatephorus cucumeris (strain AG1-IA) TaxID=983506 RepID=L8WIG8_THACA|nr:hypothetical protein AG1IA_09377 [Rhizoctonia solani AG-1 IA]
MDFRTAWALPMLFRTDPDSPGHLVSHDHVRCGGGVPGPGGCTTKSSQLSSGAPSCSLQGQCCSSLGCWSMWV